MPRVKQFDIKECRECYYKLYYGTHQDFRKFRVVRSRNNGTLYSRTSIGVRSRWRTWWETKRRCKLNLVATLCETRIFQAVALVVTAARSTSLVPRPLVEFCRGFGVMFLDGLVHGWAGLPQALRYLTKNQGLLVSTRVLVVTP